MVNKVVFVIIFSIFFSTFIILAIPKTFEIKEFDMYLIVSNKTGFDVSPEYIHFGMLMPGQNSTKEIVINNSYGKNFKVYIRYSGNFSQWIKTENNFIINANETKKISIQLAVPKEASYGNYSGKLKVIFKKARFL